MSARYSGTCDHSPTAVTTTASPAAHHRLPTANTTEAINAAGTSTG